VADDDDVGLAGPQLYLCLCISAASYLCISASIASVEHLSSVRKTLVKCAKVRNVSARIDFKHGGKIAAREKKRDGEREMRFGQEVRWPQQFKIYL